MSGHTARPSVGQIAGEVLLTAGALLLLFVIYEAFWTNLASARLQDEATAQLEDQWSDPPVANEDPATLPVPELGEAFSRVHLPALGEDAVYTVLAGTRNEDLRTGPGYYTDTQLPGEPGNFALAGHRNGSGAVFQHLDRLNSCDAIVVETETQWLTYRLTPVEADGPARHDAASRCLTPEQTERLTHGDYAHVQGRHITTPHAIEVINPLPGIAEQYQPEIAQPYSEPAGQVDEPASSSSTSASTDSDLERMLTLTTCHPQFSNAERLIVHAVLTDTQPKSAGVLPDALEE